MEGDTITIQELLALPVLLFSIVCHEVGHAYAAYRGGDDTARLQGRITLNPLPHLDPIGTVLIPILQILSPVRLPLIGWAKPVPVDPSRLRSRKWDLIVSVAGVGMNLALIVGACAVMKALLLLGLTPARISSGSPTPIMSLVFSVLLSFVFINMMLMLFNLIPIPPLDGSHVFLYFVRTRDSAMFHVLQFLERFGFIILLLLLMSGALGAILGPIMVFFLRALEFVFQMRILWPY